VLGSDTAPVREMIKDGENGLIADFFDADALAAKAIGALRDPAAARAMGRAAEQMIVERYSLEAVLPRMLQMYERACEHQTARLAASSADAGSASPRNSFRTDPSDAS
jgi:glycosyltransferase involved in cell wall biosynthesis